MPTKELLALDQTNRIPTIVLFLDKSFRIEHANNYFEWLTNCSLKEARGKLLLKSFFAKQDQDRLYTLFNSAARNLRAQGYVRSIFNNNGKAHEIDWYAQPTHDTQGNVTGVLAIGQDVSALNSFTINQDYLVWKEIINSLHGYSAIISTDGTLLDVSDLLIENSAISRDDIIGKPFHQTFWWIFSNSSQEKLADSLSRAAKGEFVRYDTVMRIREKSLINIDFMTGPLRNKLGHITHIVTYGFDVTHRTKSENELRETTQLLNNILENIPNMIFLKDAQDLRFKYFNHGGESLLGVDRKTLIGRNDYDFFLKEQADFFTKKDRMVLNSNDVLNIPEEAIETTRGPRVLHTQKVALRDNFGNAQYLLGISEDITEQKQAEETLRFQATIIEQIHDSVISTDMSSIVTSWNKGAEQLFGYSNMDMLGKHISIIFPENERDKLLNETIPLVCNRGRHEIELRMLHKSGEPLFAHTSFSVHYNESDEPVGIIFYSIDITERKLMEAELEGYREMLETLVEERTADLAAAKDEAQSANAAKSEFLSRMSHELRTPLNAILGFAQIILLEPNSLSNAQGENVNEILEAGNHLLKLINEVLDLTKVESGKLDLTLTKVSIHELMKQCLPLISGQLQQQNLELVDNLTDKNFIVNADFTSLKQVLLNLLTNAVKYNSKFGRIELNGTLVGENYCRISVNDTGKGMTTQEVSKLFTPFERLHVHNNIEGTGIGLVITKRFIESMGGKIGVNSEPGKGSCFWFELTLSDSGLY